MDVFFVVIFALVFGLWLSGRANKERAMRSAVPKRNRSSVSAQSAGGGQFYHWPSMKSFNFPVVGESYYQAALTDLAGDHGRGGAVVDCVAELIPENDNRHDEKAVSVFIKGNLVGYMSSDDARSFRRRLTSKRMKDCVTTCDARIVGGGRKKDGARHPYGVFLDIKTFDL